MSDSVASSVQLLRHPYVRLESITHATQLSGFGTRPGTALLWQLEHGVRAKDLQVIEDRPGGVALLLVLPRTSDVLNDPSLWELVSRARPHAILPYHDRPAVEDLAQVLRKPPEDVPVAVTDYLKWRGIRVDSNTLRLVRRTLELSSELNSVTALSRGLYLSRRALGRRFASRGLPVPSHWLQFGRVLRLSLRLQNSSQSIYTVACELGYPDGFAASNQMHRLVGYRPSEARERLGWEWILEAWLRREAENGGLVPQWGHDGRDEAIESPLDRADHAFPLRRRAAG
jgi:AraC-like DNA-binding protein